MFYDPSLNQVEEIQTLNTDESHHIIRVLRKQVGDQIKITNGKGDAFKAIITNFKSKQCQVKIQSHYDEKPLPYQLHIGIAPPKKSDRFEYFLEKATEIGITEITPLICENSERKRLNTKRCDKILQSAMKQSQRLFLPKLNPLTPVQDFFKMDFSDYNKMIAHCEKNSKTYISDQLKHSKKHCILIGPEGDFSHNEIETAQKLNFTPISLGEKRLRTETAGLASCFALSMYYKI